MTKVSVMPTPTPVLPKDKLTISVFFPAYNEEANIGQSVTAAEAVLKRVARQYEIIIIDDGSRDKTGEIADAIAAKDSHVRVIHHQPNQGYGAAVWAGIQAARYDYVFFTDADLQFDLNELEQLTAFVPQYKVVLGYRAKRRDPWLRLANAKGWNILNRVLFGLKVRDIDCAFKLFERRLLVDLPIRSRGAMMSAELLIHLQRQGVVFKEVPVTHLPRQAGSPTGAKPSVIFRAFREMMQAYRGDLGNVTQRQLIKFLIVGGFNTLVDFAVYYSLTRSVSVFHNHLVWAKAVSYFTASIGSFVMNRYWTFRKTHPLTFYEIGRFYLTVGAALAINTLSLTLFLRLLPGHDLPAVIGATAVTFAWNFITAKFWVFANHE